jgi:hypothetical protein
MAIDRSRWMPKLASQDNFGLEHARMKDSMYEEPVEQFRSDGIQGFIMGLGETVMIDLEDANIVNKLSHVPTTPGSIYGGSRNLMKKKPFKQHHTIHEEDLYHSPREIQEVLNQHPSLRSDWAAQSTERGHFS